MSIVYSFIFFYAQKRLVLEETGELELKKSILEDDLDTDEEEEEVVVKPQKKPGFVGKLRGMLMRRRKGPDLDDVPGGGVGVSEKSQAAEDAKAAQEGAITATTAAETAPKDGAEAHPVMHFLGFRV